MIRRYHSASVSGEILFVSNNRHVLSTNADIRARTVRQRLTFSSGCRLSEVEFALLRQLPPSEASGLGATFKHPAHLGVDFIAHSRAALPSRPLA